MHSEYLFANTKLTNNKFNSNLTNNISNLHQFRISHPLIIIFGQINIILHIILHIINTETDACYEGFLKWLLSCSYNPHKNNIGTHLQAIGKTLDKLSTSYDNIIPLGDFNVEPEEAAMSEFLTFDNKKPLFLQNTSSGCF